jgi:hypothetical protein
LVLLSTLMRFLLDVSSIMGSMQEAFVRGTPLTTQLSPY